jgi:hypothetical protein
VFFRKFVNKTIEFPDLSWILKNRENSGNYQTQKSGIFRVKNGQFFLQGEYQCIFWFNRSGWRKNSGTIQKLRERSLLIDVYSACNKIEKAILSRYIQEEDIVNEIGYIEYNGSEEASATEIFHSIYQQISPE